MSEPMQATEAESKAECFWWRDRPTERFHVLILRVDLKREKGQRVKEFDKRKCYELSADSAPKLVEQMAELGWDAPTAEEAQRLCETAPRWQLKTRRAR